MPLDVQYFKTLRYKYDVPVPLSAIVQSLPMSSDQL